MFVLYKNGLFTCLQSIFRVRIIRQNEPKNEMIRPISSIVSEFASFLILKTQVTVYIESMLLYQLEHIPYFKRIYLYSYLLRLCFRFGSLKMMINGNVFIIPPITPTPHTCYMALYWL